MLRKKFLILFRITRNLTWKRSQNLILVYVSKYVSFIIRKPVVWGLPFSASIEPVNFCNLRCLECPVGNETHQQDKYALPVEHAEALLKRLHSTLLYLMLYFQGEPLLHPSFMQLVKTAKKHKVFVMTSTNGHHLTMDVAIEMIHEGLDQIVISIDGTTQKTYEAYRAGGHLHLVKKNLIMLVKLKKQHKSVTPFITVQFLVTSVNEHEMETLKQWKKEIGFDEHVFKSIQVYDLQKNAYLLPERHKYNRYKKMDSGELRIKKKVKNCSRIWTTMVINSHGDVVPCCYDKNGAFQMGNLLQRTVKETWKSPRYQKLRKSTLQKSNPIEICKNCIA